MGFSIVSYFKSSLVCKKIFGKILKNSLIVCGILCIGLAVIGMIIPPFPMIPFLLLAAACFARSSDKFYQWLINNRYFGKLIRNYRENKTISQKTKVISISMVWASILYSTIFVFQFWLIKILLIVIAVAITWYIVSVKTLKSN